MSFNSVDYALFFMVVFVLYWGMGSQKVKSQNLLLLGASYFFYAQWDARFLFLLVLSTLFNFMIGRQIHTGSEGGRARLFWLYLGVTLNVWVLAVFKLPISWLSSIPQGASLLVNPVTLKVMLPVGVSFYTFCGLSYIIDIYKKKITPSTDYIEYAVFIGFFPALTAGPIERASHFLPQLRQPRRFDGAQASDGLRQLLWGLFKKVVIADGCAQYVNMIFGDAAGYSASTLVLGAVLFSFQIYADFSGYSDMALGSARLLGIELMQNFAFPYFSRDIAEFWRRWHMSLSSWFRDYVFFPLERRRLPLVGQGLNTVIVFLLTGLWHGFNWTFVAWGGVIAAYFLILLYFPKKRNNAAVVAQGKIFPTPREVFELAATFGMITFAWVFFRADTLQGAVNYISAMVSWSLFSIPEVLPTGLVLLIFLSMVIEWLGREQKYALAQFALGWPRPLRWAFYYTLVFVIFYFSGSQQQFIYSQF